MGELCKASAKCQIVTRITNHCGHVEAITNTDIVAQLIQGWRPVMRGGAGEVAGQPSLTLGHDAGADRGEARRRDGGRASGRRQSCCPESGYPESGFIAGEGMPVRRRMLTRAPR